MSRFATTALLAATLIAPAPTIAGNKPNEPAPLPSSYAPRPHLAQHVYGSPIGPPAVNHAQPPRPKPTPTRRSTTAAPPGTRTASLRADHAKSPPN